MTQRLRLNVSPALAGRFFTTEPPGMPTLYIYKIHSSVDRHLGHFHVLAVVNSAATNIGVHVSFQIMVFSRQGLLKITTSF